MNKQEINVQGDIKKYYTMLPNIMDDSDLDPFEFRLLVHYYRVGACWEGTKTTAQKCNMSVGAVSKKRRSLAEKGWILIQEPSKDNPTDTVKITLVDRWADNANAYSRDESPLSPDEQTPSLDEPPLSPDETKNNQEDKNNQNKNTPYGCFERLEDEVQRGIKKGQTLRDCKKLLVDFTASEIVDCAKWIKHDPFLVEKGIPIHTGMIVQRIDRWVELGRPTPGKHNGPARRHEYDGSAPERALI